LPGAQRGQCDKQLRQIAERGIEQATDHVAGPRRHGFGGMAQQRRQRHDGGDGEHEQKGMGFGFGNLRQENHRHQHQQP